MMSERIEPQRLLDAALQGDGSALGKLLDHFRQQLKETIHANLQGPLQRRVDESDIVQLACLRAVNTFADQFRGQRIEEFWGWLEQIQRNTLIDAVRNQQAQRRDVRQVNSAADADAMAANITSPSYKAMRSERRIRIEQAIHQLPPAQQEAVRLRFLEDRKIDEVAQALGKSPAATAQLIYRGISTLKKLLKSD